MLKRSGEIFRLAIDEAASIVRANRVCQRNFCGMKSGIQGEAMCLSWTRPVASAIDTSTFSDWRLFCLRREFFLAYFSPSGSNTSPA